MQFPVWHDGEPPPPGVGGACDAMDGKAPLPFGSCIYKTEASVPKFRAEDLKARAVDENVWYDNFIIHGLPKKVPKTANDDEPTQDASEVLNGVGGGTTEAKGQLGKIACSILMRILYAARLARFDLLRITCKLATRVSRWSVTDDAAPRAVHLPPRQ